MAVEASLSYGRQLVAEAKQTHPWLHHPLFQAMAGGRLSPSRERSARFLSPGIVRGRRLSRARRSNYCERRSTETE